MIEAIIIFIFILGFIVLTHEFAHFLVAKASGIRVDEFSIGFSPTIFSFKKGDTKYCIGAIPFGGYVKIYGMDDNAEVADSFWKKPAWKRINVVAAGVVANLLIGYLFFVSGNMVGLPTSLSDTDTVPANARNVQVEVLEVMEGSAAEKAGILPGDAVKSVVVGDKIFSIETAGELQDALAGVTGEVTFTLLRGQETIDVSVTPVLDSSTGKSLFGISFSRTALVPYSFWESFRAGAQTMWNVFFLNIKALWQLLLSLFGAPKPAGVELMSPVGVGFYFNQMWTLGSAYALQFAGLISLGFAITNLLPLPALDGGYIAVFIIEAIRRKAVNIKILNRINQVAFSGLLLLMIFIVLKDVAKFIF